MDEVSYHNDLCFAGDFSSRVDQTMNEYFYGKCLHRIGSKKNRMSDFESLNYMYVLS